MGPRCLGGDLASGAVLVCVQPGVGQVDGLIHPRLVVPSLPLQPSGDSATTVAGVYRNVLVDSHERMAQVFNRQEVAR